MPYTRDERNKMCPAIRTRCTMCVHMNVCIDGYIHASVVWHCTVDNFSSFVLPFFVPSARKKNTCENDPKIVWPSFVWCCLLSYYSAPWICVDFPIALFPPIHFIFSFSRSPLSTSQAELCLESFPFEPFTLYTRKYWLLLSTAKACTLETCVYERFRSRATMYV